MTRDESKETKAWLWGYRDAVRDCRRLEDEYKQLIASQEGPKAIEYNGMPSRSGDNADVSSLLVLREDFSVRIDRARRRVATALAERSELIEELHSPIQRDVMSKRYIQLDGCRAMNWKEIAIRTGYSEQHIFDLHGQALEHLHKLLESKQESNNE